jgi:DNA-binding IscR family transcriptional regulator
MVLSTTTCLGLHTLLWLATQPSGAPAYPPDLSRRFGYELRRITEVCQTLAYHGLLVRSGPRHAYSMTARPESITLLAVVEACQGKVPGHFCQLVEEARLPGTCGLHQAMAELQRNIRATLSTWTLDRLLTNADTGSGGPACLLRRVMEPAPEIRHASHTPV